VFVEARFGMVGGKRWMLITQGVPVDDACLKKYQLVAIIGMSNGRGGERKREDDRQNCTAAGLYGALMKCLV